MNDGFVFQIILNFEKLYWNFKCKAMKFQEAVILRLRQILYKKAMSLSNFNPLSANPKKWSNILKQFFGNSRQVVWVCLTILWVWRLKG